MSTRGGERKTDLYANPRIRCEKDVWQGGRLPLFIERRDWLPLYLNPFHMQVFFPFSLVVPTRFYVQGKCVYALNYGPFFGKKKYQAGLVFAKIVLLLFYFFMLSVL